MSLDDADDSGLSQSSGVLSRQSSSNEIRKVSPDSVGGQRHRSTDVSLLLEEVKVKEV